MIEPALIAIIGTGGGAIVLKVVGGVLRKPKAGPTISLATPADSEQQKFNHKTRMLEKDNFPDWDEDWYTKCDCSICCPPEPLVPAKRPEPMPAPQFYTRYVDGMVFRLPAMVPPDAAVDWDYHGHYAVFSWYKNNRERMAIKVIPTPEIGMAESYDVWSDQYAKPVQSFYPDRVEVLKEKTKILRDASRKMELEIAKFRDEHTKVNTLRKSYGMQFIDYNPDRQPKGKGGGSGKPHPPVRKASTISTTRGKK